MDINPSIFKAYDIRGVYPSDINEDIAYRIAQAYAKFLSPKTVAVGRDVRVSGPALFDAVRRGLVEAGVNVVDIGMGTTDMMYFAVAKEGYDGGIQITASHNPREFNGMKVVREKAHPISGDSGIYEIRDIAASGHSFKAKVPGTTTTHDIRQDYLDKVFSVIDVKALYPMRVVANCNFGSIGPNLKKVSERLPVEFIYLNEEPNGEFPKGRPDPLILENRTETVELVKREKPNFGAAWDADADRCFFIDEKGRFLSGYFTCAVLAEYLMKKTPKAKIVTDMKLNWAIIDTVRRLGGQALPNKTGHSFFKERMIREDGLFGGEVSSHFYFRDFFYLDNGLIPFLLVLEMLSKSGKPLSEFYDPYFAKYFVLEETNSEVGDVARVLSELKEKYSDGRLDETDGIAIEYPDWRFSVRSSNTEPLVRLNLEARSKDAMEQRAAEVLAVIRS